MVRKLDLKSFLLVSNSPLFQILKISKRVVVLPSLIIYVTSKCNFRCKMCALSEMEQSQLETMDFSLIESLISQCHNLPVRPRLHFSGFGEPLVYPKIRDVFKLCKEAGVKWSLTTNGYLLERYADDIIVNDCNGINLSIHGTADIHNRITGIGNAYEKTMAGISKLNQARQSSQRKNPLIALNCVIVNENYARLDEILDNFLKIPVNSITFQFLSFSLDDLDKRKEFLMVDKKQIDSIVAFKDKVEATSYPVRVNFFPRLKSAQIYRYYGDRNYPVQRRCVLPWLSARIYPNGEFGICGSRFGNVKSEPLAVLLNNEPAIRFRDDVRKGKYSSVACFRCCHQHYG